MQLNCKQLTVRANSQIRTSFWVEVLEVKSLILKSVQSGIQFSFESNRWNHVRILILDYY